MANNTSNDKNTKNNEAEPLENQAVTAVEVVKDDTVVYEEGDFEDYNAKHDYQEETTDSAGGNESVEAKSDKQDSSKKSSENKDESNKQNQQSSKKAASDKESKSDSDKEESSKKDDKSSEEVTDADAKDGESEQQDDIDQQNNTDQQGQSEQEDSSSMTMSGMFQWASKLREDFMSEAMNITSDVTEKATAMTLQRLIAVVDMELAAFDKSVEVAKNLIANVEEERGKIAGRKEKYQDMLDKLDQDNEDDQDDQDK